MPRQRLKTPWATNQSIGKARKSENLVKSFPNDIARKGGEGSTTLSRLDYVTYFYRWMTLLIVFFLHTLFVSTVLDQYSVQNNTAIVVSF